MDQVQCMKLHSSVPQKQCIRIGYHFLEKDTFRVCTKNTKKSYHPWAVERF